MINLLPKDGEVYYIPQFLDENQADYFFSTLIKTIPWRQDSIKLFGKQIPQPRLTAYFGTEEKDYRYSGITMVPNPWTEELLSAKEAIEKKSGLDFNAVLINLYRNGRDSMAWHSDDEPELGTNPSIASLSLGETRVFKLRHKDDASLKFDIQLTHGSLLLMQGATQHFWQHSIPKTSKTVKPRINLTFRNIF